MKAMMCPGHKLTQKLTSIRPSVLSQPDGLLGRPPFSQLRSCVTQKLSLGNCHSETVTQKLPTPAHLLTLLRAGADPCWQDLHGMLHLLTRAEVKTKTQVLDTAQAFQKSYWTAILGFGLEPAPL